ncbi:MAG: hypothetical protein HJJLKODD_00619 [Phycisphaerae bacterium]|nr:hypothetical protein [Phycisphaerae bacterium]
MKDYPLAGRTIVLTRSAEQNAELQQELESCRGRVISCPMIELQLVNDLQPLKQALCSGTYQWLLLTSGQAVEAIGQALAGEAAAVLSRYQIAVVGPGTGTKITRLGGHVHFLPSQHHFAALCTELLRQFDLIGQAMLYPCGDLVESASADPLRAAGACVDLLVVYRNQPPERLDLQPLQQALVQQRVDVIVLTSPSAVRHFFSRISPATIPPQATLVTIGPRTSAAVREFFGGALVEAERADQTGIVQAIRVAVNS